MILPQQVNLAEIAYQMHLEAEEKQIQARVIIARELDAGYFDSTLATQTQKWLVGGSADDIEGVNLMSIALNTVLRRVNLKDMDAGDVAQNQWLQKIWTANRMTRLQREVHRLAQRDGEAFVIVQYDEEEERPWQPGVNGWPRFYVHGRFTGADVTVLNGSEPITGDNQGCKAFYRNNDPLQPLDMVSQRWTETIWKRGESETRQRMTLYIAKQKALAGRTERYVMADSGLWMRYQEEGKGWPIWLTEDGSPTGKPLPFLAFHFRNEEMIPATKRLWGLQAGMDQQWSSLLGASKMSGYQILVTLGFVPTKDGKPLKEDRSNIMDMSPGQVIGTAKTKSEADVKHIPPGDLKQILDGMDKTAVYAALTGQLPVQNFTFSRQVVSADSRTQGESDLIATVHELQDLFGSTWQQVFEAARRLYNIWGKDNELDESKPILPRWAPPEMTAVSQDEIEDMGGDASDDNEPDSPGEESDDGAPEEM